MVRERALSQVTLRKYEKPKNLDEREISKRLCLSYGLLQPGDSRDVVVDILMCFIENNAIKNHVSIKEVEDYVYQKREKAGLEINGITPSNILRQIRRIKNLGLIEKLPQGYRIKEFMPLKQLFYEHFMPYIVQPIIERIGEFSGKADTIFSKKEQKPQK